VEDRDDVGKFSVQSGFFDRGFDCCYICFERFRSWFLRRRRKLWDSDSVVVRRYLKSRGERLHMVGRVKSAVDEDDL
jgi:hypothetical protein